MGRCNGPQHRDFRIGLGDPTLIHVVARRHPSPSERPESVLSSAGTWALDTAWFE